MSSLFLRTARGEIPAAHPPIWLMRQAGRYLPEYREIRARHPSFLRMCLCPETVREVTLQPIRRFGLDAAIIFSDILVIPWGLGQHVDFITGRGPVLSPLSLEEQYMLKPGRLSKKLSQVYEAISLTKASLPVEVPLIGFAGAPWTLATYMIEGGGSRNFERTLKLAYQRPDAFKQLLSLLTDAVILHLLAQIDAGADAVQIFDSWAGAVPEPLFEDCVLTPTRRITSAIAASHPSVPVIGFAKGIGSRHAAYGRTGISVLGVDAMTSPAWLLQQGISIPMQGNIDNHLLLHGGSLLAKAVRNLLTETAGRLLIVNLGHGILPETPIPHVEQLVELVRAGRSST